MPRARDVVWGRRGGRWAGRPVGNLAAEVEQVRARARTAGTWPELHHTGRSRPTEQVQWQGLARMAAARAAAGRPLSPLDIEALDEAQM